ncbi:MAG TPA: cupin domain-containing protein [Acidimicrobiales bacterium]
MTTADDVIRELGLAPHPEGGWYRETWREEAVTAIYFLLREGERSHWHRVDATEIWHFYAGDPLELAVGSAAAGQVLGPDHPQHVVPAGEWQAARSLGRWSLVGCTVSPAFRFEGFELAPPGWQPPEV